MSPFLTSLVVPYGKHTGGSCGYCNDKSEVERSTWGMSAKRLTVSHYQYLIDHGWRRSGTYCYKPLNSITCCPCYTIRCDAVNFRLSRSHKRVLKLVTGYLKSGEVLASSRKDEVNDLSFRGDEQCDRHSNETGVSLLRPSGFQDKETMGNELTGNVSSVSTNEVAQTCISSTPGASSPSVALAGGGDVLPTQKSSISSPRTPGGAARSGPQSLSLRSYGDVPEALVCDHQPGASSFKSPVTNPSTICSSKRSGKARARRWTEKQKRFHKLAAQQSTTVEELTQAYFERRQKRLDENKPKELEDYLMPDGTVEEMKHFIEIRLVRSHPLSPELEASLSASHLVYQKYQMAVHGDDEVDCDMAQFRRFLVNSPLVADTDQPAQEDSSSPPPLGSYHQQYWLDGTQLIAVGVIDLLPKCLSSVYLFYDPAYAFLRLGVYSALREIAFVRRLIRQYGRLADNIDQHSPYIDLNSYYMGYYIKSCPKMSYKASYRPAYLACPVTYEWVPIHICLRLLGSSDRCSRFSNPDNIAINASSVGMAAPSDSDIDAGVMCLVSNRSGTNCSTDPNTCRGILLPLARIAAYISTDCVTMLRDWARLVGEPALSGQLQVYF